MSPITLAPGLVYHPDYLDRPAQERLLETLREITRAAPLFTPRMPRTGKPFSVRMTGCGRLGWVSDEGGYRYQPLHPGTGEPWPPMPEGDSGAPVFPLPWGPTALFRYGGFDPRAPTRSVRLNSGDAIVFGGPAR